MTYLFAISITALAIASTAHAADTFKFAFKDTDVTSIIEAYAKETKRKFVVDPSVRGKASIFTADPVPADEALNLLSTALEANGYAISDRDDVSYVAAARNIQRSLISTINEAPALKPVRMMTMVFQFKYADANEICKRLRVIPSKDGEMTPYEPTNQLIVTDWTPNLIRIHQMLQDIDKPAIAKAK